MWQDPIVAEIRASREAHAAQYHYDLKAIYAALKELENQDSRPKVQFSPKRISSGRAASGHCHQLKV
jgi:hypothetical protein